uniref:Transcription factor ERF37 n=1 Tax=Nothapodytes nimmoniana TaxID=159386 RepID=A0A9E9C2H0_NOTNI|nr:transcription factor ERF37 [Nothapodytes nimmoniana]
MDVFSHYSEPFPSGCYFRQPEKTPTESSFISDGGTARAIFSDEEVQLASDHPKRRDGRKKFRETRHPVYRGVRRRNAGKWVCEVREPNKKSRIWLGTFPTSEMAARAHDVAALALRGKSACMNFADSAWRLPVPASNDAKDIQKAAAEAAESFRPTITGCEGHSELGGFKLKNDESEKPLPQDVFFMDEEAVMGMPAYLANMAAGMMLSPPHQCQCAGEGDGCIPVDDVELEKQTESAGMSLWSYSI